MSSPAPRRWRRGSSALTLAASLVVLAPGAAAQGRCGGDRVGTPACNTTPAAAPFAATGWKTVALDHFRMVAADPKKEAAYYAALMNWTVRSDKGGVIVMDIGDVGSVEIHGGYQPPPPPPTDTSARGRAMGARAPRNVTWDSFCWVIEPWDTKKVEAALRERGLSPVADHDPATGFYSFHVKDPDGFDVQVANGAHVKARRAKAAAGSAPAPAPFASTAWTTVWLDHISFEVTNYKETTAFYEALLGWKPTGDEGSQNETWIGDLGNIIIRGGNPLAPGFALPARRKAQIGHVSFGIDPWDTGAVKGDLDKRGLNGRADTGGRGDINDPATPYKSYHTTTPNGFDLQISNSNKERRVVR
ncbi:MAG: VOC family protein [Gemmatimonadetes bacterium]|nr:VOC family protein [Gemmatimonadota bacterium]